MDDIGRHYYLVARATTRPTLQGDWNGPAWSHVPELAIDAFRPESSSHRPVTRVKLSWDEDGIYGLFKVNDRYVRCVARQYQDPMCRDSCVEFFVKPKQEKGYFNFEFSGNGQLLCSYITDWTRLPGGFKEYVLLPPADGQRVRIYHSLPAVVDPEITTATEWTIEFVIPLALFRKYVGELGPLPDQAWAANFYKCGDRTSHPHWAAWSPVDEHYFHLPRCFGTLEFR